MAAINPAHWSVDSTTKAIRYIGPDHTRFGGSGASYSEVIELHRWLQDLADDPTWSNNDEISIAETNPSSRSTDNIITLLNGYNIDDNAAEHLFDGSIIQSGGDEIYDGIVNFGNSDVSIQILQSGTKLTDDWWNLDPPAATGTGGGLNASAADGISHRFMIKVRTGGADIDGRRLIGTTRAFGKTYGEFIINATSRGNNVLALSDSNDLNNNTAEGTVGGWTTIVNNNEGYIGLDVSGDGADEFYYSNWTKATFTINQLYERAKWYTRDGSTETVYGLDGEDFRGITHQIELNTGGTNSGTFNAFEPVSWSGGTGQMLAIDNTTAASANTMWIQLLTGSPPAVATLITGGTSSATATTAAAAHLTTRTIATPFIGQSTGSAIIGAYGIGITPGDLTSNDQLFDLTDSPVNPPNNVTFTVNGLRAGEDYVLVAPWDGSSVDGEGNPAIFKTQLSLLTTLNTDNITQLDIDTDVPDNTPSAGTIRVTDDKGLDRRLTYSSFAADTPAANQTRFTITTTDGNEDFLGDAATAGNDVWLSYIDVLTDTTPVTAGSFTIGVEYEIVTTGTTDFTLIGATDSNPGTVFTATGAGTGTGTAKPTLSSEQYTAVYGPGDTDLVVLVRDGGATPIVQFISSSAFTGSNSSITAIRTSDL